MTHLNEFNSVIREPTPEHAQDTLNTISPLSEVNELLPNIFNRIDNHEDSRVIASDTVFNILDIVENQLNDGIDTMFNSGLVERIADLVLNLSNSVIERATDILI